MQAGFNIGGGIYNIYFAKDILTQWGPGDFEEILGK